MSSSSRPLFRSAALAAAAAALACASWSSLQPVQPAPPPPIRPGVVVAVIPNVDAVRTVCGAWVVATLDVAAKKLDVHYAGSAELSKYLPANAKEGCTGLSCPRSAVFLSPGEYQKAMAALGVKTAPLDGATLADGGTDLCSVNPVGDGGPVKGIKLEELRQLLLTIDQAIAGALVH
ncbi:MAG TPA: hypothetical protein VFA20_27320 [Myxococcaceae bacterium]|nr:hypothetical protein [Myxococcaceae bacterium]